MREQASWNVEPACRLFCSVIYEISILMFNWTGFVREVASFPGPANTVGNKRALQTVLAGEMHSIGVPGQCADAQVEKVTASQ